MADRFPSLEEFSEGQSELQGTSSHGNEGLGVDDDFITRERAALGDDAAQFATAEDNVGVSNNGDIDLLGGDESYGSGPTSGQETQQFESSFPPIDTRNEHMAPGGTITGSTEPFQSSSHNFQSTVDEEEEPEPIRIWREKRDADLKRRDQISAEKKAATIKAAQGYIDGYYENYNKNKDKAQEQYRKDAAAYLANRENTSAGGTSWDRVAKITDLSGKGAKGGAAGTSKEKMRTLLLSLTKDENAPGAKGV